MRSLNRLGRPFLALLFVALAAFAAPSAKAQTVAEIVPGMYDASLGDLRDAVAALVASGEDAALPILQGLGEGELYEADNGGIFIQTGRNTYIDALTGTQAELDATGEMSVIRINNSLRRDIAAAVGSLTLMSEDPATRRAAAEQMFSAADPENIELLDAALAQEDNSGVRKVMEEARAASMLNSEISEADFAAAVATIAARGDRQALGILNANLPNASEAERVNIEAGIASINQSLALWGVGQNVWYGVSLGSVLLLAAIGLAITFGVMGVINMAHGEMVMIGAYVTFMVQEVIRTTSPELFDYSLTIAIPVAFAVTGLIGVAIERGIIRWLYGRPLETLLATWGLSLIIQQGVRTIFGATNREVGNPSWMSGAFELGGLAITWNRMWIVVFALVVFALLLLVLNKTPLGLQMRAVTQNRRMASAMGIRTPWVDAMTFGLGSGVAGLAGVALSQIDNVSPNLGQSYIIDSFMVVVFGGVGNLWGTLVGALTLGVANKFLEPYAGAVLAKILILVLIILFIQRRPRGLFALKGRAVEA
ncbi:urea ABC transporter permease subunit UrtB [Pelagibacterium halotolerans]|uniref:Urea ABC transporter, permease protein UrtB n=1 Tax=Pelagibacterium halotolerans (strain DSM 22347 / JCM 15775 / CGMCC 1.7692 / B2) TaxID=1082931 RepID=G4RA52_PELHB|nr:urea ABC transporter permease subunit UrtB [Pelagibacterium halotolerans]AEQ53535.1 urea ABC transporter, permease protein UrtB [Pelagibacterium halotolerans B2]QJR20287.1 urea ABC transporter permease subunit UrtB [Pelagibacterium halotolerans]SEA58032.1 amino acid/amide ABC transporter membrane protein 1, HAAT family [Pelagibacterium halotolerans]